MSIAIENLESVDLSDVVDETAETLDPVHPGEILKEEFLEPREMTAYALAKALDVPLTRLMAIIHGRRSITADTALRLGRLFGTTPQFWMNLQGAYDLDVARLSHGAEIEERVVALV